jgi:ribosome-associated protein
MRRRHIPGEPEPPTKGELKRQAHSVQELAEQLVDAPDAVLNALQLPETIYDAIQLARRITSRGALVRQKQFIGKLMRKIDVEPVREALESRVTARRNEARRFHRAERWRDRILAEGDDAVEALVADCPQLDTPQFRGLASEAQRERARGQSRQSARELFRALSVALNPD